MVLLLVAGCSGADDSGARPSSDAGDEAATPPASLPPFDGDDFYAVPDPLPDGDPGDLIRYEPVEPSVVDGARTWRVMYLSESLVGEPIAVTGTVVVPEGAAPDGGRLTLTIAHGTTGVADECAPSKDPQRTELSLLGDAIDDGYVVALTDYEGLGTPGRHPYLVGESEGRSVLDAARAAAQLPDAATSDTVAIMGYSQGGHGALWAGEIAATWAPELEVVGTVAGAPATEMPIILRAGSSGPIAGFVLMTLAGYDEAYPEVDLSTFLTPAGEAALPLVDEGCARDVIAGVAALGDEEPLVRPGAADTDLWTRLATENDPGHTVAEAPVLVLHSAADELVPAVLSEMMVDRMCDIGQVVERRVYDRGEGHGAAAPAALRDGLAWLDGLVGGGEPVSTCD